ncbi:hypothetical protein CVT25_006768 [Psilocybe cyanescens]|uniref:Uncharacterized protein n=1 Tax=Psilocybe cyanescens TaxID=93625 RepID=A0A409X7C4_PSICY|nr:hypothetical protein CVT25_006768 [Psilocybe cyanescens]
MVYSRSNKISKVSYAERKSQKFQPLSTLLTFESGVLGAALLQMKSTVKKTAQAKKVKLGPQWSHWVGKAISKLESEGILEPASPSGTVALTSSGKQAARRSILPNASNDFSHAQEQLVWKQVVSGASKRARATSVDNLPGSTSATPKKNGSPRKRARPSDSPSKKSVSRMTKAETLIWFYQLKAELDWLREQAQVHDLLRGVSPLTDLDDEEEVQNAQLREELKEREEEIEQMRRELSAARAARHGTVTDDEDNERDPTPVALPSHVYPKGLTRTQSGSYISNLSKQPTPAPSSPDRDMFMGDVHTEDGTFDFAEYPNNEDTGLRLYQGTARRPTILLGGNADGYHSPEQDNRLIQGAFPATPQSRADKRSHQDQGVISTLKAEIEGLREQLEEKTTTLCSREAEIKALSDRAASFESIILNRENAIAVLRESNARLSAEVADQQRSWKQAEDTVVKTAERLAVAESSVEALKRENASVVNKLVLLETSNEELHREKDALFNTIGQLKQQGDLEASKEQLEIRLSGVVEELELQKRLGKERQAEIVNLNEKHSTDLQVVRQKNDALENLVSTYRAEIEEKGLSIDSLGNELSAKDFRIEDLSTKLREMGKSADDLSARFSGAESSIALLSQELKDAKKFTQALETTLEATVSDLRSEVAGRQEMAAKLSEKEKEIGLERGNATQLHGYLEELKRDIVTKDRTIQQLSQEVDAARGQVTSLEYSLAKSTRNLEAEREQMSAQLSNLEAAVASTKIDLAGTTERLADANRQLIAFDIGLEKKNTDLNTLSALLDKERQEKSRLAADLDKYVNMTHDLRDELREYETSKALDEATILNLRQLFANIRDSQMKIFGEIEEKVRKYFLGSRKCFHQILLLTLDFMPDYICSTFADSTSRDLKYRYRAGVKTSVNLMYAFMCLSYVPYVFEISRKSHNPYL